MKKKDLKDIFMAGVDRVLGYNAVNDYLNKNPISGNLNLISIGKAGSSMAKAALENKKIHITSGIIITKIDHLDQEIKNYKNKYRKT